MNPCLGAHSLIYPWRKAWQTTLFITLSSVSFAAIPIGSKVYADPNLGAKVRKTAGGSEITPAVNAYTIGTVTSDVVSQVPITGGSATKYDWYFIDWEGRSSSLEGYSASVAFVYPTPDQPTPLSPGFSAIPEIIDSTTVTLSWVPKTERVGFLTSHYVVNVQDLDSPNQPTSAFGTTFTLQQVNVTRGHRYRWYVYAWNGDLQSVASDALFFQVKNSDLVVSISSGPGGSASPTGSQSVPQNGRLDITAIPDAGFEVDQWTVDNNVLQNGGVSFTLNPVVTSSQVFVSFRQMGFRLNITAIHGQVTKAPDQSSYSNGSEVILIPIPDQGYMFAGWSGDWVGSGAPARIVLDSDKAISASFVPNPASPRVGIGGDTASSFSVSVDPIEAFYLLIMRVTTDGNYWFNYDVKVGTSDTTGWELPKSDTSDMALCTFEIRPIDKEPAFLLFPIKGIIDPYAAPISALFDLDNDKPGVIRTYRNELGTAKYSVRSSQSSDLVGFQKDAKGSDFRLDFNTGQKQTLWYDDHTGYDYPATLNTEIIAAAGGTIDWEETKAQKDYNALCILHDNGYRTYYLHLSRWSAILVEKAVNNETYRVKQGETIGWAGNIGVPGATKEDDFVHLHFTVKNSNKKRVDPYGEFPNKNATVPLQPILWILQSKP